MTHSQTGQARPLQWALPVAACTASQRGDGARAQKPIATSSVARSSGPHPEWYEFHFGGMDEVGFAAPLPSIRLLEQMLVFPSQFSCQLNHRQVTGAGYEHHVKLEPDYVVGVSVTDRGMGNAEEPNKVPPPSLLLPLPMSLLYGRETKKSRTRCVPRTTARCLRVWCAAARAGPAFRPPRTKWTRRVPHPVLIGHAASLTPYAVQAPARGSGAAAGQGHRLAGARRCPAALNCDLRLCVIKRIYFIERIYFIKRIYFIERTILSF